MRALRPAPAINASTGVFSWTPTEAQGPGTYPITVRVTDNGTPALSDFEAITVTVNEVNAAPVLAAIGNKTVRPWRADLHGHGDRPGRPANALTFSLDAGAPAGATIDASTGAFSWTPTTTGTYPVTVRVTDNGTPALSDFEAITITVTPEAQVTALRPNFPNPFSAATRINYRLQQAAHVRLALYDIHGREVKVLVDEDQGPGDHSAVWDGSGRDRTRVASGVYICRLTAGGVTLKGRMILER